MQIFYKEQKVRNFYITAFGLLMISYFLVFSIIGKMERRYYLDNRSNSINHQLGTLLSCRKEAEATYRGFVIIRDTNMLAAYRRNILCVNESIENLRVLIEQDTVQSENLDSLTAIILMNRSLTSKTIDGILADKSEDSSVINRRMRQGVQFMEKISAQVAKMQQHENEVLANSTKTFNATSGKLKGAHFTTFVLALILVIYSLTMFNNVSKTKLKYREQLEEGIEKLRIANNDLINLRSIEKFSASGRIARTIAHEVRNPLTSISLAIEQLKPTIAAEDDKVLLDIIERNVDRIHGLVVDLLNSTKFVQLKLQKHSLNEIVDQALELAKDRIDLNGIKVIKNISPNPCLVELDIDKMKTALLNLMVNAVEAMEPGNGILEITTIRSNGKCAVHIKDNGSGMNESALSKIFEPYYTQKAQGSGLGLTLTQNIVLNHKGNISVDSRPGKGSTFTISIESAE